MKTDVLIGLELEQELSAVFEESVPCEVDAHGEQFGWHDGDGEWYLIHNPCPHCGVDSATMVVCDQFKRTIEAFFDTGNVPCSTCKVRCRVKDVVKGFERREVR